MLKHLRDLFAAPDEHGSSTEARLHLASAVLLFEVARADQQLDAEELAYLQGVLRRLWHLSPKELDDLLAVGEREAEHNASLHQQVEQINASFSVRQKFDLLLGMWEVAMADGQLHHHEEHLIRRVADLLYLSHQDFIRAKLQAGQAQ